MKDASAEKSINGNNRKALMAFRVISGIVLSLVLLYVLFFMFVLWAMFSTRKDGLYILYVLIITLTIYVFLIRQLVVWRKPPLYGIGIFGGIIIAVVVAWVGTQQYYRYVARIPVFNEDTVTVSLNRFQPFNPNSPVALLPQNSTLTLNADLPKIDCALALYPVEAAFVRAVYDENAVEQADDLFRFSTSPNAWQGLTNGETDIILATRPSAAQVEAARARGVEFKLTPIGKEAFVFFVNRQNPVDGLTAEQLQAVYGGEITNWRELGGKNWEILAFQRNEGSGSQNTLEKFMAGKPLMPPLQNETIGGMGGIVRNTANYKNFKGALGFSFRYFVQEIMGDEQVKLLKVNGVYPNKETIGDNSYPLAYEFYAVTRIDNQNPNVDKLIEWMLSPQGQYLIEASGYVPIGHAALNLSD